MVSVFLSMSGRICHLNNCWGLCMRILLPFIGMLAFMMNAQAATAYEERVRKVEAIAKQIPDFTERHDLVVEATGVCGAGSLYYVKKGQFSATEFDWLRQLLTYRFNGTTVIGTASIQIDFEESTGIQVTDQDMAALASTAEFSKWLGADILKSIPQLKAARSQLIATTQEHPPIPEQFIKSKAFKRYHSVANSFYVRLASKFNIISIDNLVDCD